MTAWGLVPARGGSKSIPHKNLVPLNGRPLLDYVICAGRASDSFSRMLCSTDDDRIAARARDLRIEVDTRPAELASDDAKVDDVARDLLERAGKRNELLPEVVVLLQPTSPFLLPQHIHEVVALFGAQRSARSAHNVYLVPHNLHSWNQRSLSPDGAVCFPFEEERARARNKQEKPKFYAFGNLIAARTDALLAGEGFYAKPRYAVSISAPYAFDLDTGADVAIAEALIASGAVRLPHLVQS